MRIKCLTNSKIHKCSIRFLYYTFIEFVILLNTILIISFTRNKEYMICMSSFSRFLDKLLTFT